MKQSQILAESGKQHYKPLFNILEVVPGGRKTNGIELHSTLGDGTVFLMMTLTSSYNNRCLF